MEVQLTGTLKTYKAVVHKSGDSFPPNYTEIAGIIQGNGEEISILIPSSIVEKNQKLAQTLSDQAYRCLEKLQMEDPSAQVDDGGEW